MSIIKLTPAFKDYLWGGTKLKENYGKKTDMDPVAESWELSVHPDGPSIVASGEYQGLSFPKYLEKKGKGVLGTKGNTFELFPILIKFIDAKQPLSIQVHPDNEYALRVEHEYGKTEMWYVVDAEGCTLGRLASEVAKVLRGKNKPEFTPHVDTGDYVIVVNAEKVKVTGKKMDQKIYYNHSDYVGGMRETTLKEMMNKKPEKVIELAVKGMLPKGPLGRAMIKKLHVYAGPEHKQEAQKPVELKF